MQNDHEKSTISAGRSDQLTNNPGYGSQKNNILKLREQQTKDLIIKHVEDFFLIGGLSTPVENITDQMRHFFSAFDANETDKNGKPVPLYNSYEDKYITNLVFYSTETINFLVRTYEELSYLNKIQSELDSDEN